VVWEGHIIWAGEWVECKLSVAPAVGGKFSWAGTLMMRPEEWHDFRARLNLSEVSTGHWTSDVVPASAAPQA
jgi:hypothetical protein